MNLKSILALKDKLENATAGVELVPGEKTSFRVCPYEQMAYIEHADTAIVLTFEEVESLHKILKGLLK